MGWLVGSWLSCRIRDHLTGIPQATEAFEHLKHALVSAPVLALLDCKKTFIVETDASGSGIGAVLMQHGHPIAFISKSLSPTHWAKFAYERELFAILFAVKK